MDITALLGQQELLAADEHKKNPSVLLPEVVSLDTNQEGRHGSALQHLGKCR